MKKIHVGFVAVLLGVAAVLGVLAATRTAGLGAAARTNVTSTSIAERAHRLDRVEVALRKALRDGPPALPAVPTSSRRASAATAAVVYRRPAPIVVLRHTAHRDDVSEQEGEHEADD
jgi:hypothetical protein